MIVEATGREVILKGSVSSWHAREEADRAAWLAPGVTSVDFTTFDYHRLPRPIWPLDPQAAFVA